MNTTTLMQADRDTQPWYREPWTWLLMIMPVTAIIAGSFTMYLAVTTFDGLVVDDYYKEGMAINTTLARGEAAQALGLTAQVHFTAEHIVVTLAARAGAALPAKLHVTLSHPTRGGLDQVMVLDGQAGRYEGALKPVISARWKVLIEDESRSWRLTGTALLPTETEIRINAADLKPVE